ncbi:helix-turn-helix domain-containing protein [Streptomyces sp. AJS327]|uniref:response regulator transcription factor n=1 Tax=Streptomyces sp. AJS327 TaxID=2545265 RepID=UPI0015DEA236|nr:response regulator transcription factor [Streptomyces sp. AJS327]MBA0053013.1 helix-turn-helix domain-containing protein [Streptomyces sp. AJS327]
MGTNEMAVLGIAEDEERIYRHFLRNPETPVTEVHLALELDPKSIERQLGRLCELGLLRRLDRETVAPVDPEGAVARLIDQRLGELHEELQQVTASRRLAESLRSEQRRPEATPRGIEQLTELHEIRDRIDDLAFFARDEVLSVEPYTALTPENIQQSRPLDLRCLNRGLSVRNVVLREALEDADTLAYLRELEAHGARIRVVDETTERVLIYDRHSAVVPLDPEDSGRGALIAHEGALVNNLVALFERIWDQGEDLDDVLNEGGDDEESALSEVERQVFVAMCSGDKDEVNARSIGVSVRTYRRHVAELMQLLGAGNRAQAALLARDRGWV